MKLMIAREERLVQLGERASGGTETNQGISLTVEGSGPFPLPLFCKLFMGFVWSQPLDLWNSFLLLPSHLTLITLETSHLQPRSHWWKKWLENWDYLTHHSRWLQTVNLTINLKNHVFLKALRMTNNPYPSRIKWSLLCTMLHRFASMSNSMLCSPFRTNIHTTNNS